MELRVVLFLFACGGARVEARLLERLFGAIVERCVASAPSPDDVGRVDLYQLLLVLDQLGEL